MNINNWYSTHTIQIPSSKNAYGDWTYTYNIIEGRLILTQEQIVDRNGQIRTCSAKFFTSENLDVYTLINNFKIITKKECRDKNNNIEFYKYTLE